MELGLLVAYLAVGAVLFSKHASTYSTHMRPGAVNIGECIPPEHHWRIWYSLLISAVLWPLALLIARSVSGNMEGPYANAIRFTAIGMLLGGGWGM